MQGQADRLLGVLCMGSWTGRKMETRGGARDAAQLYTYAQPDSSFTGGRHFSWIFGAAPSADCTTGSPMDPRACIPQSQPSPTLHAVGLPFNWPAPCCHTTRLQQEAKTPTRAAEKNMPNIGRAPRRFDADSKGCSVLDDLCH